MHPRNIHNVAYNFDLLISNHPDLATFIIKNKSGDHTIDFSDPKAVLALNTALLKSHYGVKKWDIPDGFLCPAVPGRADYIHHLADMLYTEFPNTKNFKGLDIGTGANCIYPILGTQIYNWTMVGCDINKQSFEAAQQNMTYNSHFKPPIEIRFQSNPAYIFKGIVSPDEYFDFCMCNPPFHNSEKEATKGTLRKLRNLGNENNNVSLNFGGQSNELWCNGGEALFLKRMIKQSVNFSTQIGLFTSLVAKKEHLPKLQKQLSKLKATHYCIEMSHGNKKSRVLAWRF